VAEKISLLVADDEAIIRRKLRMMLADTFLLDEAASAETAREAARRPYDAILLDIVFPDGNGIDICKEIKQARPHTTVVISSSMESVDAWDQAFQAGADGYVEKREILGLDPRKIVLMINNLVERNRLRREAEQTNKRQAELLSVLSHDVRAPFQALLGTIELLMKSRIPVDAVSKVEDLYRCAKDQLAFINSLLELLRLESAAARLRMSQVDVNLPVGQSLQSLRILAQAKDLDISADLSPDLPRIQGDIGKIAQLMNNLFSNAIKFTPRCGRISVTTRACSRQGAPGVEIRVEDTGIGMRLDDPNDAFQRFRRGRDQGTEGEKGSGLGLAICKQIVQIHGGTIEIGRATPKGTVVSVKLPAWLPPAGETPHAKKIDTSFQYERIGRQVLRRG